MTNQNFEQQKNLSEKYSPTATLITYIHARRETRLKNQTKTRIHTNHHFKCI
jgi:hypothetical protein